MGYAALREEKAGWIYLFNYNTKEDSHDVKRSSASLTCPAGLQHGGEGHQVWCQLQAGLSPGLTRVLHGHQRLAWGPLRLAEKQTETLLVTMKFGNKCETEIRGSNNDRLNVLETGLFLLKIQQFVLSH